MEPKILDLKKIFDPRGNLSVIQEQVDIPFNIVRAYWIYDVPGGYMRGGHAYRTLNEFIVALSGSFDVVWNNGTKEEHVSLSRSYYGLYIPNMFWRHLENFSTNSVALILSDQIYSESDYIRDINEFIKLKNG